MSSRCIWVSGMAAAFLLAVTSHAQTFLNEILFAPPGPDIPNQYIELRGTPNAILQDGTYLVALSGNTNGNPGTIENVFDLSGRVIGGNGFLVLLQKSNPYAASASASVLVNSGSGSGFGSGSGSSIGHKGRSGRTDLPHAAVTFLLIQSTNSPNPGSDMDTNNDGTLDGRAASWTVLDSVGIADAAGDIAYGQMNFAHSTNALATGTITTTAFTPIYVARTGNTIGSVASAWLASGSLSGAVPNWSLTAGQVIPPDFGGAALNHLGLPNFGASNLPGLVASPVAGLQLQEANGSAAYTLNLNTKPAGAVGVQISPAAPLQVSVDAGVHFTNSASLNLTSTSAVTVLVSARADNTIGPSPQSVMVSHAIVQSGDPVQYPVGTLAPTVPVAVMETEQLLLNELKVNPPGTNDSPCEYIELRGPPNCLLQGVHLLAVDGDATRNPGQIKFHADLSGRSVGSNGLLIVAAPGNPYSFPSATAVLADPDLAEPGGALKNTAVTYLLVSTAGAFSVGTDLDAGDNGILEGLPSDTTILDAVGWQGVNTNDIVYDTTTLPLLGFSPDALVRFDTNNLPASAGAWFFGELATTTCDSLVFDSSLVSSNFPFGAALTPGANNHVGVQVYPPGPLSGVIGDPENPAVSFVVSADLLDPASLIVTASSSNPQVVPDSNLRVVNGGGGQRTLFINPVGVGYASIVLTCTGSSGSGQIAFPYAASDMGRPGGRWHTFSTDASTALAAGPDYMIVGDNQDDIIRLYSRTNSGPPVAEFDFQLALGLLPEEHGEVNIEASTRVGNRLFFMGAHSNANSGSSRTNRNRVFAVDLTGSGTNINLVYAGRYDHLKEDLISWDSSNGHGKGSNYYGFAASAADTVLPKAPDGFNIEGLSMAPGSTNVGWIGFRAPIVPVTNRTFALIVPVLNFTTLAVSGAGAGSTIFGDPIEIDLYGRGIRSMEGDTNGVLISGGPAGDVGTYPDDFRLYTWSGNPAENAHQRAVNLTGLQPEGIVELPQAPWDTNSQVQFVTDNGATVFYADGIQDKHLLVPAFKKFRSDWVSFGGIVPPTPIIKGFERSGSDFNLTVRTLRGLTYAVEANDSGDLSSWTQSPAVPVTTASGPWLMFKIAETNQSRFYRVRVESSAKAN